MSTLRDFELPKETNRGRHSPATSATPPKTASVTEQGVQGMTVRFRAALLEHLAARSAPPDDNSVRVLEGLFVTCLSSIEQSNRRTKEVNTALHRFNEILEQQIRQLAHS